MEISDIKSRLSIQTVLKHYNLQADRNHMLQCPFHEDDKPSLKIYSNTNTFNCFGCGANGDVIEFIQKKENCSKHKALLKATELCTSSAIALAKEDKAAQIKNSEEKAKCPVTSNDKKHVEILSKIYTSFKNGLNNGKAAKPKEYLESRRLDFTKLDVGYNSGQFHH